MEVTLLPYQDVSLQDPHQFILWHGGRGSGKSRTLVMDLYNCCCLFPRGRFALCCNDYEQLRDATHETLTNYLYDIGCPYTYNKNDKTLTLPNGSTIHELTLNKDKTALKGPEWDGVFFDEADGKHTTEDKFDYLVDSCRGKIGDRRIRVSCNPVPPGHFLAKRFFIDPKKDHKGYRVSTYDNADNLPVDYIPRMEAKYPPGTDEHKRWMMGELVSLAGSIYPMFGPDFIIDPEEVPKSADAIAYGLDLGTIDPTVLLEGRLSQGGVLYVTDEYYLGGKDIVEHIPALRNLYKGHNVIFSDHSATAHSILLREGFNVVKAYKDVERGIQMVKSRFHLKAIKISTNCQNLINDMYNYCWRDLPNSAREEPEHKYSHGPDALRYLTAGIDFEDTLDM